ncbi:uncharacterized protein A4U43_C09F11510 [Asparagus officinalis]|uniref:Uncharacterized protein n=1 Tax=Asparagus officinalis TaxID=4686 RepID=A0A5P1EBT0_ASPOF|nr:UPF0481 protein At3g47200-like [Asparagus officinalis]ONK58366.1 uncharacterized protein A4U43_C09F11510 [Asparagus officinalis]
MVSTPEHSIKVLDQEWVKSWKKKLRGSNPNNGGTSIIFRVSDHIRATDPNAYEPKVVSIGPYHHNKPHLKPMDQVKLLYFERILQRNKEITLDKYLQLIDGLKTQSQLSYSGDIKLGEREFSDMLLLDGCFIVELLLSHYFRSHEQQRENLILNNMTTLSLVEFDMLLLENQLPFVVLKGLLDLVVGDKISLIEIASKFFKGLIKGLEPLPKSDGSSSKTNKFYHLLHLFHACFIGKPIEEVIVADFPTESMLMTPCASDLMNVDVKFKQKTDRSFSWNISYEHGIIEIFPARLNSNSNSFYRNLITFEQYFFRNIRSRVMAYVMLMSCLIDSGKDLDLLRRERIVAYTLDYNEATLFFRKLCKDSIMDYDKSYLSQLQDLSMNVWELYDTKWIRYKAKLKHGYFRNPINSIYLITSAVLFIVLTILQTVYTVLSYYRSSK